MGGDFSKPDPHYDSYAASPSPRVQPTSPPKAKIHRRFSTKYSHIADNFASIEEVQQELRRTGLESSNLIVGIDFTKSNEWTGRITHQGKSLHAIGDGSVPNPYEQAISIIGKTLSDFDDDNLIPCFGFGDASTHDNYVFSFYSDHRPCHGFEEALARYRAIAPHVRLAGPTSFAPIIEAAVRIVEQSGGQYHVLVIIADGQVTRSVDTEVGQLSPQEKSTIDAIVTASNYALSIVLVGVGDGPWDMMKEFDDNIPRRAFDNFQFVNFSQIMSKKLPLHKKEALFALSALMEIPAQYKATVELEILGRRSGTATSSLPLPPPVQVLQADSQFHVEPSSSGYYPPAENYYTPPGFSPTAPRGVDLPESQVCPICLTERKDLAFGCGHQTCRECGASLTNCPICRQEISTRIRLY
ncbi:E3 ubiquitin-protein ligase RGLG3 [Selaginella moellendorffii]|uniref:E3 ubiquitin-protein ligase RGLG3 n=1 Tax=Selaginella moellendorffii TaxID=88036 RepID=UPI000D1CF27C|nr:E3 ubiquitin-protein ligase RGLG3 [Selaginella moellendorffii]|eukprot:XP_024535536.1 E3 ubiquitin-protein ligase RGLG3 [Selaginella moellendorffii]